MVELTKRVCQPCSEGTPPLTLEQSRAMLPELNKEWKLNHSGTEIQREYRFKNYYQTIAFVNAAAWIAHKENHHPDLEVSYNRCLVRYRTHNIGGLSENDFICAAKFDTLT